MDIVIMFFKDVLNGPFYIAWVIFLVILIFACIGYLAEKGINNKREKEKYATVDVDKPTPLVEEVTFDQQLKDNNVISNTLPPLNGVSDIPQSVAEVNVSPNDSKVNVPDVDNNLVKTATNQEKSEIV